MLPPVRKGVPVGSAAAAGTNEWDAAEDPCLSERMVMYVAKRKVGLEMNPL